MTGCVVDRLISDTAVIDPTAEVDSSVEIGPYCVIGPRVRIGAGTKLHSHVVIQCDTTIGKNNEIYPFAAIGADSQDLKYDGGIVRLEIGDNNVFRESITISRASGADTLTKIGSNGLFMAGSHVAHDCHVGDHAIFANNAAIAGHVEVGDYVVLGGFVAVHQFCKIGDHCFLGRCAQVVQDIIPYVIVAGQPGVPRIINEVGLGRRGFSAVTIKRLRKILMMFKKKTPMEDIKQRLINEFADMPEAEKFLQAIEESTRGLAR